MFNSESWKVFQYTKKRIVNYALFEYLGNFKEG